MPAHQKTLYPVYTHIHATPNYTFLQPPDSAPPFPDSFGPWALEQHRDQNLTTIFFTF